ncbi:hypothetical protein [Aureimonas altamirensis]|uniref:hypothetical protein n=1 Tax=Aureimonas altamirensis TaxID=370622 RepID=UPI0025527528|nr:hypothetical protein [Aureimonas altamirensis]
MTNDEIRKAALAGAIEAAQKRMEEEEAKAAVADAERRERQAALRAEIEQRKQEFLEQYGKKD